MMSCPPRATAAPPARSASPPRSSLLSPPVSVSPPAPPSQWTLPLVVGDPVPAPPLPDMTSSPARPRNVKLSVPLETRSRSLSALKLAPSVPKRMASAAAAPSTWTVSEPDPRRALIRGSVPVGLLKLLLARDTVNVWVPGAPSTSTLVVLVPVAAPQAAPLTVIAPAAVWLSVAASPLAGRAMVAVPAANVHETAADADAAPARPASTTAAHTATARRVRAVRADPSIGFRPFSRRWSGAGLGVAAASLPAASLSNGGGIPV
jgi:hypothetical protein